MVRAPAEWCKYFRKLYKHSHILTYTETPPGAKYSATLTIKETDSASVTLEFIPGSDLKTYQVQASNTPLFLYPSVHQLISRILNIMFHLSGGFVLHASAIHTGKEVLLFAGESGRGKSTIVDYICQKWPDSIILSDNSAFIRRMGKSFVVYPSPYLEVNRLRTLQSNLPPYPPYKISAVYFPFQEKANKVMELEFGEKIRLIQKNSHIPYRPDLLFDNSQIRGFSKLIFGFVESVKILKLEFVNDASFLYHIR